MALSWGVVAHNQANPRRVLNGPSGACGEAESSMWDVRIPELVISSYLGGIYVKMVKIGKQTGHWSGEATSDQSIPEEKLWVPKVAALSEPVVKPLSVRDGLGLESWLLMHFFLEPHLARYVGSGAPPPAEGSLTWNHC